MMQFKHAHSLGQNFLSDKNLLSAIVADAGVSSQDTVIEVGAGQGALTLPLCQTGARVFAFEIDKRLEPFLAPLAEKFSNLTLIMRDFLKCDLTDFGLDKYKAVANLPYYVTTPVLFKFLDDVACESATVMVQKEVAERIVAKEGGKDYGVLSVTAQLAGTPKITRIVGRQMFTPPPNVDSAVVNIVCSHGGDEKVKSVVRSAFSMRRKTLVNCLTSAGYDKNKVLSALDVLSLPETVRGEKLTPQNFVDLAQLL